MRFAGPLTALALFVVALPRATAQDRVTTADIQHLQDNIADASQDVAQLRSRDGALASQLERELDGARDETTYLKVKLERNEPITRDEYTSLRDRIDGIASRARGEAEPSAQTPSRGGENPNEIPVGTEFDVRLQSSLSSATAQPEDHFEATTMVDLRDEAGRVLVPAGSVMRGLVSSVHKATRTERKGSLVVAFDRVTMHGRAHAMRGTVTQAIQSEGIAGEKEKIGIGAGAGAILGAILGGAKGALAGIVIGGGGAIAATEGKDVDLPAGTVLLVRLDSPLGLQR